MGERARRKTVDRFGSGSHCEGLMDVYGRVT